MRRTRWRREGRKVLFDLFSPSKVDSFAETLASRVARRYPPAVANNPGQVISAARVATILEESFSGVHRFNESNRLGIFGKAKLGKAFRWALREMGYGEDFID